MAGSTSLRTDWREQRRQRAFLLEARGWRRCDIAEALGVSKAAVTQWLSGADQDSAEPWRGAPHPGREPKLSPEQLRLLPDLLSHGAEAYGFFGEVWTCARIAWLIHDEFGVDYHRAHVSRLLKQLRWTPQLPLQRAAQRDEAAIAHWREQVWPALKKRG
jgi:transposase